MPDPIAPSPATDDQAALPASVEFRPRGDIQVDPADWATRAADVQAGLTAEGLPASDMFQALNGFRFLDGAGVTWTYNGTDWLSWNGTTWVTSAPPSTLKLQPFTMDLVPDAPDSVPALASPETASDPAPVVQATPVVQPEPVVEVAPTPAAATVVALEPAPTPAAVAAPLPAGPAVVPQPSPVQLPTQQPTPIPAPVQQPAPTQAVPQPTPIPAPVQQPMYRPTHIVPNTGMPAWSQPDPRISPVTTLGPGLDVMVVEWQPSGWARIVCSNQWSGWVDGRALQQVGQPWR